MHRFSIRRRFWVEVVRLLGVLAASAVLAAPHALARVDSKEGAPAKLRIVTFNLYNRPWERRARLDRALEELRKQQPDVICLQEVSTGWILPGDPVVEMAQELHMSFARFWHEENLGIFKTGIAVLSRFPIRAPEYREFKRHGFWDAKGYMLAHLQLPGGTELQIINLHMASTADESIRRAEWEELTTFVEPLKQGGAVVVAGDFNTQPAHPAMTAFATRLGARSLYDGWKDISRMRTWTPDYRDPCGSAVDPAAQLIDHVLLVPGATGKPKVELAGGRIVVPGRPPHPSDHCPVMAELAVKN